MQLIWATKDLVMGEHPYPGFPILLWDSMESCRPANRFLRYYLLRGAIGSKKSWDPAGRALYDYFSFLQTHELNWDDCERGEQKSLVAAYRDYCLDTALLKRSTVRNRLTYVTRFYEYAKAEGWIGSLPFGFESRTVRSRSSGTMRVRDVMPRAHKGLPQFLSKAEIAALLAATTNKHHGIILRLALGTGLRREELATFPARYVVDPDRSCTRNRNISVHLDPGDGSGMKTKGGRSRTIFMSRELMKDLHEYLALRRGERASLSKLRHHTLFLNQAGAPYGLDGKSLDRIVREIGAKVGLDVWTHKLRHSYATHTLAMLQSRRRENRVEPLVFLQRQLGHASIQSTLIYLHLIHELVDDAVIAYDAELDAFTGAAGG